MSSLTGEGTPKFTRAPGPSNAVGVPEVNVTPLNYKNFPSVKGIGLGGGAPGGTGGEKKGGTKSLLVLQKLKQDEELS